MIAPAPSSPLRLRATVEELAHVRIAAVRIRAVITLGVLGGAFEGERECLLHMARSDTEEVEARAIAIAELGARHRANIAVCDAMSTLIAPPSPATNIWTPPPISAKPHLIPSVTCAILAALGVSNLSDAAVEAVLYDTALDVQQIDKALQNEAPGVSQESVSKRFSAERRSFHTTFVPRFMRGAEGASSADRAVAAIAMHSKASPAVCEKACAILTGVGRATPDVLQERHAASALSIMRSAAEDAFAGKGQLGPLLGQCCAALSVFPPSVVPTVGDAIGFLTSALQRHIDSADVCECSCAALRILSLSAPVPPSVVVHALDALRHHSGVSFVCAEACSLIAAMAQPLSNDVPLPSRFAIAAESALMGNLPLLVATLRTHDGHARIFRDVCRILTCLSRNDAARRAIRDSGFAAEKLLAKASPTLRSLQEAGVDGALLTICGYQDAVVLGKELLVSIISQNTPDSLRLVEIGADLTVKDSDGDAALALACWQSLPEVALAIAAAERVDIEAKNKRGATALSYACTLGLTSVITSLLEKGAKDDGTSSAVKAILTAHATSGSVAASRAR